MPSFCVVSNCEHKYTHSENVSFHKFPRHSKELLAKWIQFTDRGFSWKPSRWSAICSRHFLPSDFRDTTSARKCLRRDSVPSITIKNFDGNFLGLQNNEGDLQKETDESAETNCRLCGLCCKTVATISSNFEVFGMIQKCFPYLNIQHNDNLPKDLCSPCLQRLQTFSEFVDNVLRTQKDLERKFSTKNQMIPPLNIEKPLKIKQEPTIKIKQEISEGFQDILNDELDVGIDEEQYVDQKSQLSEFPYINSQEIINNCDIMEIISLDEAFIDIPDDEVGGIDEPPTPELKDFSQDAFIYLAEEHNYSKPVQEMEQINVGGCKTEKPEESEAPHLESKKPNKDIIVINESIVKPVSAYDLYQCDSCPMKFLTDGILVEHKKLNHNYNGNVCPVCNANFKTFYGFLKHKITAHSKKVKLFKKKTEILSCPMCKKNSATKLALNNHKKYICKYQQEKMYECKYCRVKLKRWIHLRQHERKCRKRGNRLRSSDPSKLIHEERLPDEDGKFACRLCARSYRSRRNLLQHETSHRPLEQWNYKCGDCGKMFDFCHDLRCHLKKKECNAAPAGAEQVYFVCMTCGSQFKSLTKLKWHNLVHTGIKPFVCETCGKAFRSFNNLYQHKITHTTVRRHKCDLCEKLFKRRGGLNQHKRAYHFNLKPHECPVCKHSYALKGDMIRCKHSTLKDRLLKNL